MDKPIERPLAPIDIANKITYLLGFPGEPHELSLNGRLSAGQRFDWDIIATQYKTVLSETTEP